MPYRAAVAQIRLIDRHEQHDLELRAALHGVRLKAQHGPDRSAGRFDSSRTDDLNERIKARYRRR